MNTQSFKGTGRLLVLLFRQHRLKLSLWILGIVVISVATALLFPGVFPNQEDIMGFALTLENPAMAALLGSSYALDDFNIGVVFTIEMLLFTAIALAIFNILLVKATTREDEEEGRLEIIQALPVGKLADLVASLTLMFFVNLWIVLLLTLGLTLFGESVFTLKSSLLYSAILGTTGFFYASFTAVTAQLSDTAHGTTILSMGFLLFSYLLRTIGDVQNESLSLLSPLGWTTRTEVFANDDWTPVLVLAAGALLFIGLAFSLRARRDMFFGLLPKRLGPAHASSFLKTLAGFVWRHEKGKIIGWFFLIFSMCFAFGAILGDLEIYLYSIDLFHVYLENRSGNNLIEQFVTLLIQIMTIFSIFPGVMILHRLLREETAGRLEQVYTRAVSRNRLLLTYFSFSLSVVILMQITIALGLYSSAVRVLDNPLAFEPLLLSTLTYLPALLFILGLSTLWIGCFPKGTILSWLYILFIFLVVYLGDLFEFPAWVSSLSVLHHIPKYPYEAVNWPVMGLLMGLGLLFTAIGFLGYNRRDIQSS